MKKGVLLAIASAFIFSIINALIKLASLDLPTSEIVFFRSAIGVILLLGLMYHAKVRFSKQDIPLLCLRGAFGTGYFYAFVLTLTYLPMADAAFLVYLSPMFVLIMSPFVLKESLNIKQFGWVILAFVGVLFLLNPTGFGSFTPLALLGVLSAFLAACAGLSIRYLSKAHHTYEIIFYFMAIALITSVVIGWQDFVWPDPAQWGYLIAIGVVSLLGQLFLTEAFRCENAAIVATTRYIGIVFNAAWGILIFGQWPTWAVGLGGVLIVIASFGLGYQSSQSKSDQAQADVSSSNSKASA